MTLIAIVKQELGCNYCTLPSGDVAGGFVAGSELMGGGGGGGGGI